MFRIDHSFTYDDNGNIAQKITDRKDYHYDVWYDYTEPQTVVSKKRWKDVFKKLKEQVKRKEKTSCEVSGKDSYDVSNHKKPQQINYLVDRNNEYTKVIKENATTYVTRYASGRRETRTVIKKSNEVIKWTGSSSVPTMYYGTSAMKQAMQGVGMARNITSGKGGGSSNNNPTTKKVNVTAKCPEKEWTDYVSDFLGGIKNYFVDSWNSVEGIYDTVKAKGIVGTIKMLYDTAEEYIKNFSLDDAIAIYNMYTRYNITIDKIITWIKCEFDVDKMANEYGYESFGDWYGRNIAEGTTAIAITKMADKLKTKYFKGKETSGAGESYNSFNAFKKANPVKTQGNQWHHIVEQSQQQKSGFSVQQINNTNNLIELTPSQHSQISGYYSSKPSFTNGLTVRDWLAGQSFETQYQFGIDYLKQLGIK